jgi:hypothetical protein
VTAHGALPVRPALDRAEQEADHVASAALGGRPVAGAGYWSARIDEVYAAGPSAVAATPKMTVMVVFV